MKMKATETALLVAVLAAAVVLPTPAAAAGSDDAFMALMKRGAVLVKQRRNEEALEVFKKAVAAEPQSADACFNVGNIAKKLKKCDDVLLYFKSFLYISPGTEDDEAARKAIAECSSAADSGRLSIKTDQPGFEVMVNGLVFGRLPVADSELAPGTYRIEIARNSPDFEPVTRTVEVTAGGNAVVDVNLVRKITYGYLELTTTPAEGVDVYLHEKFVGKSPVQKIKLESGIKHFLRLELNGFDSWIRNVVVTRDKTTKVNAVLEKSGGPTNEGGPARTGTDGNK